MIEGLTTAGLFIASMKPLAILLYWLPLLVCAIGYTKESIEEWSDDNFRRDRALRNDNDYYIPRITVGSLVGRALITVVPVANLIAAMFDTGPKLFYNVFRWFDKVLDIPLVPKKKG